MGLSKSKPLHILVIGLTNSGKTHFLDMFHLGSDSTKLPTYGYYETIFHHQDKHTVILTEYGGTMDWKRVLRGTKQTFDAIYMVIRSDASVEDIMESNNELLMMAEELPNACIGIIWNIVYNGEPTKLKWTPRTHKTCICYLDFSKLEWRERVSELIEWTIANNNSVPR